MARRAQRVVENITSGDIKLSVEEAKTIWNIVDVFEVKGGRYVDEVDPKVMHLWG